MSEITREHALFNIKTVLRAFVNKIENAREYIDYLPLEGKEIVQAYESDKDDCRTLLLAAKENEDFFAGLSDENIIAYANVCYELNELLGLRVKNLYKVTKIKDCGEYKLICNDGDFVSPPCSKDFSIVKINGEKVNFPTTLTKRVDWQLLDANEKVIDEMSFKDIIDMNPFTRTIRFPDKGTYTVRAKIYAAGLVSETLTDVLDYKQTINGGEIVNSDSENDRNSKSMFDSELDSFIEIVRNTVGASYSHTRFPTKSEMDCSGIFVYAMRQLGYKVDANLTAARMASGEIHGIVLYESVENDRQGNKGVLNFYKWGKSTIQHVNYGVGKNDDETDCQIIDASEKDTWQTIRNNNTRQIKKAKEGAVNQTWAPFSTKTTPDKQAYLDFSKFDKEIEIR